MNDGKIGVITEPIINIENGQIIAFKVKTGLLAPKKMISLIDIVVLDPKIVIIKGPECVISPDEVIRAKESLDKHFTLMRAKAYTKNNHYLGRIEDAVIDNEANIITKFYIKHFLQNRILPAERVIEIKKNRIIFDDSIDNPEIRSGIAA